MDLVIDVGNTLAKLAVFDSDGYMQYRGTSSVVDLADRVKELEKLFSKIEYCLVSSVRSVGLEHLTYLEKRFKLLYLTSELPVAFTNQYKTPKTLGVDRIALVSAVYAKYAQTNVLVIDIGTCITYDFMDAKGVYYGGAISPGVLMRYKAMHTFTEKLPLLEPDKDVLMIGANTNQAMHSGVILGVAYEIDGFINAYREKYSDLKIILTGGDTDFLRDNIKNDIFVNSNLLLEGLFNILNYNKDIS